MAVGELEFVVGQSFDRVSLSVENFDFGEDVGNLLAVGTDVLDGSSAGEARDFGQGFDAGETFAASILDDVIPVFAAHDFEAEAVFNGLFEHALHAVDNDDAVETFIATDGVGAVAEDKSREFERASKAVSVGDIARSFDF